MTLAGTSAVCRIAFWAGAVLVLPQLTQPWKHPRLESGMERKKQTKMKACLFPKPPTCAMPSPSWAKPSPRDAIPPRESAKLLHTTAKRLVCSRQSGNYYFQNTNWVLWPVTIWPMSRPQILLMESPIPASHDGFPRILAPISWPSPCTGDIRAARVTKFVHPGA